MAPPPGRGVSIPPTPRYQIAILFASGATGGGLLIGAVFGGAGWFIHQQWSLPTWSWSVVVGIALLYALCELLGRPLRAPTRRWLVPMSWARFGRRWSAFLFGAAVGGGVFTTTPYIGLHLALVAVLIAGVPMWGVAVLGMFGLFRGLVVLGANVAATRAGLEDPRTFVRSVASVTDRERVWLRLVRLSGLLGATALAVLLA